MPSPDPVEGVEGMVVHTLLERVEWSGVEIFSCFFASLLTFL